MRFLSGILIFLSAFNFSLHAEDLKDQLACQAKLEAHFRGLKPAHVSDQDKYQIEERAAHIDDAFAQARSHISKNSKGELVADMTSSSGREKIRLLVDSGAIVLGYKLSRGPIAQYICSDLLR